MEDLDVLKVNTTAFTIFLLLLSALGVLWTVFCSWLTGRKKRQRVASNAHGDDLPPHVETPLTGAKGKTPDRYSAAEQVIILPIDDLGRCLHVPIIVITPPTPQDTPLDASSLPSDSSIGSTEDLVPENQSIRDEIDYSKEVGTESESGEIEKELHAGDSMGNILDSDPTVDTEDNIGLHGSSQEDMTFPIRETNWIKGVSGVSICGSRGEGEINCSAENKITSQHEVLRKEMG